MSPRRLHLALLAAAACGAPPVEPQPAPISPPAPPAAPAPTPTQPVPEASPPAPVEAPPVAPPAEDPPSPPGTPRWQLAVVREGPIALHALADGSVAVRGDIAFAVAPPRTGPLRRERAWTRGLALDDLERSATSVAGFGGRWPDLAFITLESESGRVAALHTTLRWQAGAWMPETVPAPPGQIAHYPAFAGISNGPLAGLRSFVGDESEGSGEDDEPPPPTRLARPILDRLTPDGRAAGPWPALPAGPGGAGLLALANGDFVVMRSGPVIQHWQVGSKTWKKLPAIGYTATGYYDGVVFAGRDPTRLYLAACPELDDPATPRLHRHDGTRWVRMTPPACITAISEADDTTLWIVAGGKLYRDDPGEPQRFDLVPLPPVTLGGRESPAWRAGEYGNAWRELPAEPPSQQQLTPTNVLAFGPDDIWVTTAADTSRFDDPGWRFAVLTTRPIKAPPLYLPDDALASIEAHAQEPDVLATSAVTACADMVLDLGDPADTPQTSRPPALAAALAEGDSDLRRLTVITADLGTRHGVQALWFADRPEITDAFTQLSALAERLRKDHPRVRLLCRIPIVTAVLK